MCIDVDDNKGSKNFNHSAHHNHTSCSAKCNTYAYIRPIVSHIFMGVICYLHLEKEKCFNKKFFNADFVMGCPTDDLKWWPIPGPIFARI